MCVLRAPHCPVVLTEDSARTIQRTVVRHLDRSFRGPLWKPARVLARTPISQGRIGAYFVTGGLEVRTGDPASQVMLRMGAVDGEVAVVLVAPAALVDGQAVQIVVARDQSLRWRVLGVDTRELPRIDHRCGGVRHRR